MEMNRLSATLCFNNTSCYLIIRMKLHGQIKYDTFPLFNFVETSETSETLVKHSSSAISILKKTI